MQTHQHDHAGRPDHTADRADAFLRRQSLWHTLIDHFRHHRPDETQLGQVSTVAEVAIDQVFSAHQLTDEQCQSQHGVVKDYAECAALYGYVLGYWQAQGERDRAAVPAPSRSN